MITFGRSITSLGLSLALGAAFFFILVIPENPYVFTREFWNSRTLITKEIGAVSGNIEGYRTVGIGSGVWNGGKAALWDLNIIDHFRLFGSKERARGYRPSQPIFFSHVTHVQRNKIECQYCHWTVTKSPFANIPMEQSCVGCHNHTLHINMGRTDEQKAEIAKIGSYYDKNIPIPWVKVHASPDFVRFNHKRHIKAGLGCQECHGQIPEMSVVERVSSMKMGWCKSCHFQSGGSIDCSTCHK